MVRLLVLSRNRRLYSVRRMREAARLAGHTITVADPMELELWVDPDLPRIYHGGRQLPAADVVVPRIGASITTYGLAVLHQFEVLGVPVVNPSRAIARARDKLHSFQLLSRQDVKIPRTIYTRSPRNIDRIVDAVGGFPCIVKLVEGTQGVGVMIAESRQNLESMIETFFSMGQNIIIQQFIAESRGRDVRAFVVGDKVVGAMRRQARVGEFRSNIHRGGSGQVIDLDPEYERVALLAAKVLGLRVAGVDLLEGSQGPMVMEVNSSPGFEGLERATGKDIAKVLVEHAAAMAGKVEQHEPV